MTARRAAVLGSPISHSLSPALHRAAYGALGLDWTYDAIEVDEVGLPAFLHSCGPEWAGLSLTMPLKSAVLPELRRRSDLVEIVGAANTVVFEREGLAGHNTDVPGMQRALREAGVDGWSPRTGTILGGGATARSALAALSALGVADAHVVLRTPTRADELAVVATRLGIALHAHGWDEAAHHLEADVVIATVPAGASEAFVRHVPPRPGVLLDVAYGSGLGEGLVAAWRAAGGRAADGLDLLLWQAVDQVRLMTGDEAPVAAMRAALDSAVGPR